MIYLLKKISFFLHFSSILLCVYMFKILCLPNIHPDDGLCANEKQLFTSCKTFCCSAFLFDNNCVKKPKSFLLCVSFTLIQWPYSHYSWPHIFRDFPLPHKQLYDTSWVSCNLTQFWHYLGITSGAPGDSSVTPWSWNGLSLTSEAIHKSKWSLVLLTDWL